MIKNMTALRIPFGLDRTTKAIIEPEDAARGRACNCICPGCLAPLLSRHPKEHRIHFAHDSKHPEAKPEEECPFSSAVAIAMMARELVAVLPGQEFAVPDYHFVHHFACCDQSKMLRVAGHKGLTIASAHKKPVCAGQTFDLELGFGEARILVELFYKGKPLRHVVDNAAFAEAKAGVLGINCDSFDMGFLANNKRMRFSDAVLAFLLASGVREWCFHPRQLTLVFELEAAHQCPPVRTFHAQSRYLGKKPRDFDRTLRDVDITRRNVDFSPGVPARNAYRGPDPVAEEPQPVFEPKPYRCGMCQETWLQTTAGAPTCPNCKTHLYSMVV